MPRTERLGYSLCAMLDEAKRNGLYQEEDNFPVIPEVLPLFAKASNHFMSIIQSQEPRLLETLMHHSCRYLCGKAVEAAFLWAKSPDGNISINFEPGEMANQTITTDLPDHLERIVISSMDEFGPYFKGAPKRDDRQPVKDDSRSHGPRDRSHTGVLPPIFLPNGNEAILRDIGGLTNDL